MESEECGIFFHVPKTGNLYYMNTDQLQYVNNHISARKIPQFFSLP